MIVIGGVFFWTQNSYNIRKTRFKPSTIRRLHRVYQSQHNCCLICRSSDSSWMILVGGVLRTKKSHTIYKTCCKPNTIRRLHGICQSQRNWCLICRSSSSSSMIVVGGVFKHELHITFTKHVSNQRNQAVVWSVPIAEQLAPTLPQQQ